MNEQLLSSKVALITGGTRGIGKAIALCFAAHGASVALFGTNAERGEEAVKEVEKQLAMGQQARFYRVDVASKQEVEQAVAQVYSDFGKVDVLVNNAGVTKDNLLMRLSEEDWESVLNTNLKSVFLMSKACIRTMMKERSGKIINVSSVVALMGNAGQTNYAASKAGMVGFTKSLAKEVSSRGITVNCIAPGFIETDMTGALNEKQKEQILAQIPMQKMGQPEDIAYAALYLASPLADYVTGQVLTVDGGMVM